MTSSEEHQKRSPKSIIVGRFKSLAALDREKKSPDQNIEAFNPSRFITLVS
jgi:hypothetical protein